MAFKSIIGVMCACLAVVSINVNAVPVSYYQGSIVTDGGSGEGDGSREAGGLRAWINTNDTRHFGWQDFSANATVGLDTGSSEMWYENFDYYADGFSTSFTDVFTVDFGEVARITTTVNINSIQSNLSSPTERQVLKPTTDGKFKVDPYNPGYVDPNDPIEVSGSYNIAGPTETVAGEFSFLFENTVNLISYNTLDAISYPEPLLLMDGIAFLSFGPGLSGLLFSGVIDGVDYTASIYTLDFTPPTNADLHLTSSTVPIPAAVWLFGSGLIGLVGMARRSV